MSGIIKKTKQTAIDQARKTAKQIAQEPYELVKTVVPPHIIEGAKNKSASSNTEAYMGSGEGDGDAVSEEVIEANTGKRLRELEEEIKKIREERRVKEEEWKKNQEALMQPQQQAAEQPFVEAPSKKKRGFMGMGAKKKQGTKEMGKQKSG